VLSREHLLQPAGNTLPNPAQGAACFLCHGAALLVHGQIVVHQYTKLLLCRAVFQLLSPPGVIPPLMQESALPLAALHDIPLSPIIQPFQTPLNGNTTM